MNINAILSANIDKLNFVPIESQINKFQYVELHQLITMHTTTQLLDAKKYCWKMNYKNLCLKSLPACTLATNTLAASTLATNTLADNCKLPIYANPKMYSLSGETNDICLYLYSQSDLIKFIELNKKNNYSYLPITIYNIDSANGERHDMLLIFDNKAKYFYCLDGNNTNDYLMLGTDIPKNAIDILFIQLADITKLGYNYEPKLSWQINDVIYPYKLGKKLNSIQSTAWCYITMILLNNFGSIIEYMSMLDTISDIDRFHLLYSSIQTLISDSYSECGDNIYTTNIIDESYKTANIKTPIREMINTKKIIDPLLETQYDSGSSSSASSASSSVSSSSSASSSSSSSSSSASSASGKSTNSKLYLDIPPNNINIYSSSGSNSGSSDSADNPGNAGSTSVGNSTVTIISKSLNETNSATNSSTNSATKLNSNIPPKIFNKIQPIKNISIPIDDLIEAPEVPETSVMPDAPAMPEVPDMPETTAGTADTADTAEINVEITPESAVPVPPTTVPPASLPSEPASTANICPLI